MKTCLRDLAVGLATAAVVGSAGAVPVFNVTDWGAHDPVEMDAFTYTLPGPVSFYNVYTFAVGGLSDILSAAVSLDAPPTFNIEGGSVTLYLSDGDVNFVGDAGDTAQGLPLAFDSTSANTTFGPIGGGNYFYLVAGAITGTSGGSYLLSSALTAVPEPGTYALLFAGLGVMGFVARRRRVI